MIFLCTQSDLMVCHIAFRSHVVGMCDTLGFTLVSKFRIPLQVQHGWEIVPGAPQLCTCLHLFPFVFLSCFELYFVQSIVKLFQQL